MNNLLISLIVSAICLFSVRPASAEPFEKNVASVDVKNMKSGYKLAHIEFEAPITLLRKACNGDRQRDCLYKVEGKKEISLYDFNPDDVMVSYTYQTVVHNVP